MYRFLQQTSWMKGVFWLQFETTVNPIGGQGEPLAIAYTPMDKPAEQVMAKWFGM